MSSKPSAPQMWSMIIAAAGLAFLGVIETASAVYAFSTADRTILLLGLPVDAVLKTAASVLAAVVAFGGAVVASAKRGKGKTTAYAITALCFGWTAMGFSGFTAWARGNAEAAAVRSSPAYHQAEATLASKDDSYAAYDARKEAQALVKTGEPPLTGDRTFGDWCRAGLAISLIWGMAAAFRLPPRAAGVKAEKAAKPKRRPKAGRNVVPLRKEA